MEGREEGLSTEDSHARGREDVGVELTADIAYGDDAS
jgi:hypothetical protein